MLSAYSKLHIRPLIKLNDKLRELSSHEADINVTSIVAIGDQSHGKTSVIEALSGIDLPRGEDIQTRLPLVLKLKNLDNAQKEYAKVRVPGKQDEEKSERINLEDIADCVRKKTSVLAGDKKDVVDTELELTVYRHDQDDLTLIDLPGMTRVALEDQGQSKDIEERIKKMYRRYIQAPETVLLNVVTCMVDAVGSASLQMSKEHDPNGNRTLLCFTKIDQYKEPGLMSKIIKTANQVRLPLERIFCVKNRSQAQNDENIKLTAAREEEDIFFSGHPELEDLPSACKGVKALSRMLVQLQFERIKQTLPLVASKVRQRVAELEQDMLAFQALPETAAAARTRVQLLLTQVERSLQEEWRGRVTFAPAVPKRKRLIECLEFKLELEDLASTRKKAKFGSAGAIKGEEVDNHGVAWYLEVHPLSNAEVEPTVEKKYDVAAFVCWKLPDNIASVDYEFEMSASSNGKELARKETSSITAKDKGSSGFGVREFISYAVAETCEGPVKFSAQVFPSEIVYKAEQAKANTQLELLCASVQGLDEAFCKRVNGLYPNNFFFSTSFRNAVKEQVWARRGAVGLPGAIVPEPSLVLVAQLQSKLPALVQTYVTDVAECVRAKLCGVVEATFGSYPKLHLLIKQTVEDMVLENTKKAMELTTQLLELEEDVHTDNHYYMDTVQAIRKLFLQKDSFASGEGPLGFLKSHLKRLKGLSNEEQKYRDLQIDIFAYWKTLKKRFIDYTQMAVRRLLVKVPVMGGFIESALQRMEEVDILQQMQPDRGVQLRRDQLALRLQQLLEAQDMITKAQSLDLLGEDGEKDAADDRLHCFRLQ